jgi:hypothetical protein
MFDPILISILNSNINFMITNNQLGALSFLLAQSLVRMVSYQYMPRSSGSLNVATVLVVRALNMAVTAVLEVWILVLKRTVLMLNSLLE